MFPVHEKIRLVTLAKGWTQEVMAEKLEMSINGYGNIERGNCDITLSKLEQIANLFGVDLLELLDANDRNVFNFMGTNNTNTQNNQKFCTVNSLSLEQAEHQLEIEKLQNIIELNQKEIVLKDQQIRQLTDIFDMLKK